MDPEDLVWFSVHDYHCMSDIFLPVIEKLGAHEGKHWNSRAQRVEQIDDRPGTIFHMQLGRLQTQNRETWSAKLPCANDLADFRLGSLNPYAGENHPNASW